MKLNPFIQKLSNSSEYREFQKKNGDAFLVAGFFVLDLESGQSLHQIDYYVPSKKKVAAFTLDRSVTLQMLDLLGSKVPNKLADKTKIDIDAIKGILEDEMRNRSITEEIRKIIAVVQNVDGKIIWNLNCILSGMSILNAHIEDESETVLKMERKSLADIARAMPASELKKHIQLPGMQAVQGASEGAPGNEEEISQAANALSGEEVSVFKDTSQTAGKGIKMEKAEAIERIKKLELIEDAIKKEKEELLKSSAGREKGAVGKKSDNKKPSVKKK